MDNIFKKVVKIDGKVDTYKFSRDRFIEYVKKYTNDSEEFYALYILRRNNEIEYGRYEHGIRIKEDIIKIVTQNDLKVLYELLQTEFADSFCEGYKQTFGIGWSLVPQIGDNIMIDINSDNPIDKNWFFEESHKEQNNDYSPKK